MLAFLSAVTMQTLSYKEEGAFGGKGSFLPQSSGMSWWTGGGSQMTIGGSCNSMKTLFVDHSNVLPAPAKETAVLCHQLHVPGKTLPENEGLNMGPMRLQSLSTQSGYDGTTRNDQQHQQHSVTPILDLASSEYLVPHTQLELGHSIGRTAYPCADPYFGGILTAGGILTCYGGQTMVHPQILGVQQARIPLPSDVIEDEPVYVNAKQYHGILRRRKSRAKAESENKVTKTRKPYQHESRHLHAMRRPRGCGGRFLNTKKLDSKVDAVNGKLPELHEQSLSSSGSEALNSENGNTSSAQEVQGSSAPSGSEVTSLSQSSTDGTSYHYSQGSVSYLNNQPSSHFHLLGFHSLPDGNDEVVSRHGGVYPMKWIAAEGCCNPMKV